MQHLYHKAEMLLSCEVYMDGEVLKVKEYKKRSMKQVNFKELNVEVGIDTFMPKDFRKDVGNVLHQASDKSYVRNWQEIFIIQRGT